MVVLDVDFTSVVVYTNKLEKLRKSALPNAVRNTLNKVAFNVKMETMPKSAQKTFVIKQANFFKANSRVDMAKGFDISSMRSTVGFIEGGLKGGNNYSVKDLEQQEYGGTIQKRAFIPMKQARSGEARPVRPSNRLSSIKNIVNASKTPGNTIKQQFLNAVKKAGVGGYVIGNNSKKTLWKIESINKGKIKMRALYSFEEHRKVGIKRTSFMEMASVESGNRIEDFYIAEAKRQHERTLK